MNNRNYEKKTFVLFLFVVLTGLECLLILFLIKIKIEEVQKISGFVSKKDHITVIVSKKEKQGIYQNKKLRIKDKYYSYEIGENKGVILKKNHQKYYEIIIHLKNKNKLKTSDSTEIIIHKKNIRFIEIFKIIWEGD